MTRPGKMVLASLSVGSLLAACRPLEDEAEEFRNGVPRQETVTMNVPAGKGQALTVEAHQQALQGATADLYKLTRNVSGLVNGGGALVLGLVKAVISHRPTTLSQDMAVWGPWSEARDRIVWKVTVQKMGERDYHYRFEGRDKASPEGPFVTILSGKHTPAVDADGMPMEGYGAGTFTLDWDARNTLPPDMPIDPLRKPDVGKATYVYARASAMATVEIDAQFRQVHDDDVPGGRTDVDYRYRSTPGVGGSMEFLQAKLPTMNMPANAARWAVKSRWQADGAGRSDVRARGGDIQPGTQATATECWDSNFASRYVNWLGTVAYGNEATDCVFKTADYSQL